MTTPDFTQIPYQSDYPRQTLADWQAALERETGRPAGEFVAPFVKRPVAGGLKARRLRGWLGANRGRPAGNRQRNRRGKYKGSRHLVPLRHQPSTPLRVRWRPYQRPHD